MAVDSSHIRPMDFMVEEVDFYRSGNRVGLIDIIPVDQCLSSGASLPADDLFSDFGTFEVGDKWFNKGEDSFSFDIPQSSTREIPSLEAVIEDVCSPLPSYDVGVEELNSPASSAGVPDGTSIHSPRSFDDLEELLDLANFMSSSPGRSAPVECLSEPSSPGTLTPSCSSAYSSDGGSESSPLASPAPERRSLVKREDSRKRPYPKVRKKSEEQKSRKRQQNRDAALRYRSKKKDELGTLVVEADKLEETNKKLKEQVLTVSKEIDYLKNLMLDVIKARLNRNGAIET